MSDDFRRAADTLHNRLDEAEGLRSNSAGACKNCKWADWSDLPYFDEDLVCAHPAISLPSFNVAKGKLEQTNMVSCSSARRHGLCGPSGKLFELSIPWLIAKIIGAALLFFALGGIASCVAFR